MAANPKFSETLVNAEADASRALLNNGYIRVYNGVQAVDADTPVGAQTLLAELRFGTPAYAPAVGGVAVANPIAPDTSANATGTATWYRFLKSDGVTVMEDGSADVAAANLVLNTTNIVAGAIVSALSAVYSIPKG